MSDCYIRKDRNKIFQFVSFSGCVVGGQIWEIVVVHRILIWKHSSGTQILVH